MSDDKRRQAVSYFRAILGIFLVSCIGLLYVKREVDIDETASRIKRLETELGSLHIKTAEAGIRLEELAAYDKIAALAGQQGLVPPTVKAMVVNITIDELPPEMKKTYRPLELNVSDKR